MVKIVTGKMNDHKTSRMKAYYQSHPKGDGFISIKHMDNNLVHHYDLYRLSSQETYPYIIREDFYDGTSPIRYQIGPYLFYDAAFEIIENQIDDMIIEGISPIYLDEIGMLELDNKGLHHVLLTLLDQSVDLCLVIREDLVDDVIKKYHIKTYEMIGD